MKNIFLYLLIVFLAWVGCNQFDNLSPEVPETNSNSLKSAIVGGITLPFDAIISAPTSWVLPNNRELRFQTDGNLVIYNNNSPIWASGTNGKNNAKLHFQSDGNIVIYYNGSPVWATGSHSYGKVYKFADPGFLCVEDQFGTIVWRSHYESATSGSLLTTGTVYATGNEWVNSKGLCLYFQPDGNLVLYTDYTKTTPIWATGTNGNTNAKLIWQTDGNLVVYNSSMSPKWASNTVNKGYILKFHDDGLMIINDNGTVVWKTFFTEIPATDPFKVQIAKRWAPLIVQWVEYTGSMGLDGAADFITSATYDNNWNGRDNWENLYSYSSNLKGKVYYSVLETETHWFIFYGFFHPRDWLFINLNYLDCHENDLEGTMHIIRKNNTLYGQIEAAVTVSHSDFFSFTAKELPGSVDSSLSLSDYQKNNPVYVSGLTANEESIDGPLYVARYEDQKYARPMISSSAMSHAVKAFPLKELTQSAAIIYRPQLIDEEKPMVPYLPDKNPTGSFRIPAFYELEDIFAPNGLMSQIDNMNFYAEANRYAFAGDTYGPNSASCPWSLNDKDDSLPYGYLTTHSGLLTSRYFGNLGNFARQYVGGNPYDTILMVYQQQPGYVPNVAW